MLFIFDQAASPQEITRVSQYVVAIECKSTWGFKGKKHSAIKILVAFLV
jgi:hypothetical protein